MEKNICKQYDKALVLLGIDCKVPKLKALSKDMVDAIQSAILAERMNGALDRFRLAVSVCRAWTMTSVSQAKIAEIFGRTGNGWVSQLVGALQWAVTKRGIDANTRLPMLRSSDDADYFVALSCGKGDAYLADKETRKARKADKVAGKKSARRAKRPVGEFAIDFVKAGLRFNLTREQCLDEFRLAWDAAQTTIEEPKASKASKASKALASAV